MRSPLRIVLLGLLVFVVTGCAGPKISSSTGGFEILWAKQIPPEQSKVLETIPALVNLHLHQRNLHHDE
jgi:hypothetical protein